LGVKIRKLLIVLFILILVSKIITGVNIEKYEPKVYFASKGIATSDPCTCVPDSFNGVPTPEGCWPYDGCIGSGSGPCDDGIDNDCDCKTDCYDPQCGLDCGACTGTCDDPNCAGLPLGPGGEICSPGGEPIEFCYDGFDNDADDYIDECDADCNGNANIQSSASPPYRPTTEVCDGLDNDCEGGVDEGGICDPSCDFDSDCGVNGWVGSPICYHDDVDQMYRTYICNNPGEPSSYCTYSDSWQKKQECYDELSSCGSWGSNYCKNDDVYHSRACTDLGCYWDYSNNGFCYSTQYTDEQLVEDCNYGCGDGECLSHCVDGIKDGDETGIDCGGSCLNQDCCTNDYHDENLGEEGIDCGGSCPYSCIVPIILVHGYYSSPNAWTIMGPWLTSDSYTYSAADIREGYLFNTVHIANGDIKEAAKKLGDYIYQVKEEYRAKKVDIIAHCMGGLAARLYVNRIGSQDVRNLIMLGTPNHGSERFYGRYIIKLISYLVQHQIVSIVANVADFAVGKAGEQMTPYSSFLNELNNGNPLIFWKTDDIISPNVNHYTYSGTKGNPLTSWILPGEDDDFVSQSSVQLNGVTDVSYDVTHYQLIHWYPLYAHLRDNYLFQGVGSSSLGLNDFVMLPGNLNIENLQELPLIKGTIAESEQKNHTINIDPASKAIFDLVWLKGLLNFSLTNPSGVLIDSNYTDNSTNYYNYSTEAIFEINNPEAGLWKLHVYGLDLNGTTEYNIFTFLDTNLTLTNIVNQYQYDKDEIVYLKVNLTKNNNAVIGANVTAKIKKPNETETFTYLYDDGLHNDSISGDGIYGNIYSGTNQYGMYDITIKAEGNHDGNDFERELSYAIWVEGYPDLAVNSITFSEPSYIEGEDIIFTAEIENLANFDAKNATIELILEDLWGGLLLDNKTIDVGGYDKVIVLLNWTNFSADMHNIGGRYNISVQVSPFNSFIELNYSNNKMNIIYNYCTPNWVEVFTDCQPNNIYTGWYNDTNNCYEITGLESHNNPPANNTYSCDYCTPNWIFNDTWSGCDITNHQYKGWHDINNCEEEFTLVNRSVKCIYCDYGCTYYNVNSYAIQISAALWDNTCIIKSNGNVDCWGRNGYSYSEDYSGGDAVQVAVGNEHACILRSNGNVHCWGDNYLGKSDPYYGGDAVQVSVGWDRTCIVKSNGNVDCRGKNNYGQSEDYNGGDAIQVSVGAYHTCILKSNGNVHCFGDNSYGQVKDYGSAIQVAAGFRHTCVLKSYGNVDCWEKDYINCGGNYCGGSGTHSTYSDYNRYDAVQVSSLGCHTCVLKSDGSVYCWGGSLGLCWEYDYDYWGNEVIQVAAGGGHTCALIEKKLNKTITRECIQTPLNPDWNLISTPLIQDNNSIQSILSSIQGKYESIFTYDSSENYWRSYNIDKPFFLNTLITINPEKGYWIKMIENVNLITTGTLPTSVNYNLKQGWNLISYPSITIQNLTTALSEVNGTYTSIFAFIDGNWSSYSPEKPEFLNTLQTMIPGYGYWVKANDDVNWMFNETYKIK